MFKLTSTTKLNISPKLLIDKDEQLFNATLPVGVQNSRTKICPSETLPDISDGFVSSNKAFLY